MRFEPDLLQASSRNMEKVASQACGDDAWCTKAWPDKAWPDKARHDKARHDKAGATRHDTTSTTARICERPRQARQRAAKTKLGGFSSTMRANDQGRQLLDACPGSGTRGGGRPFGHGSTRHDTTRNATTRRTYTRYTSTRLTLDIHVTALPDEDADHR